MDLLQSLGVAVLVLVGVLAALFARRLILTLGGGSVEMSVRLSERTEGRGWALGIGRFAGDKLKWYRMFSLSPRARRTFTREELAIEGRRPPEWPETLALLAGSVVLECKTSRGRAQLAMTEQALTGFLSWLEAAPPGVPFPPHVVR